ncbi:uncharacterized protein LOC126562448 [Anopheles maculipalpis]|uniref:uncharacterized protein LOC126562448 n=1 Tax=Anopheles maculipalpis TaxID=1496333 RepID=UPI002158A341|nr:uncharacterized protein LOC126562448 [Anopheles maculipalpis]
MIPSRSFHRSKNVPHGRSSRGSIERTFKPPATPDTSGGACDEYMPSMRRPPEHNHSWTLSPSNDLNCSSQSDVSLLLETDNNGEDPVSVCVNEDDPSEHVVVKDGYTFYIRYLDEPISEEEPLVQQNAAADVTAYEVESLPPISNELSKLMDDNMLPEGAITPLEHTESSGRDWINYDELPLLLNQQKQQQHRRSVSSKDQISLQPCDTLVENESSNASRARVSAKCPLMADQTTPKPCLEGFSLPNEAVLMNTSSSSSSGPKAAAMVPDFSHYCVECEKFFPSNDLLEAHMELNHRLFGDDPSLNLVATSTLQLECFGQSTEQYGTGGGELMWPCTAFVDSTSQCPKRCRFLCDFCNISFDLVESYYMHYQTVHCGIGPDYR